MAGIKIRCCVKCEAEMSPSATVTSLCTDGLGELCIVRRSDLRAAVVYQEMSAEDKKNGNRLSPTMSLFLLPIDVTKPMSSEVCNPA